MNILNWLTMHTNFYARMRNGSNTAHQKGKILNILIPDIIIIIIMQDNNRVITKKNDKGKLPLFSSNGERVITIFAKPAK